MLMLHKDGLDGSKQSSLEEGQSRSLCSNNEPSDCPSFGLDEDADLSYLAKLIVEIFLEQEEYAKD